MRAAARNCVARRPGAGGFAMLRVNSDVGVDGTDRVSDNVMCELRFAWQSTCRGRRKATQLGRTEPAGSRGVRCGPSEGRRGLDTRKTRNDARDPPDTWPPPSKAARA